MKRLNLGCGSVFHPAWTNLDIVSVSPAVVRFDITKSLPFSDGYFDVVYHSHVLEHFSRDEGSRFLCEATRVLKKGGIMRVVVPDLEQIVRTYLQKLQNALDGDSIAQMDYEWIMIELLDQTVRTASGGMMKSYLSCGSIPNLDFVKQRVGVEAEFILKSPPINPEGLLKKLARKRPSYVLSLVHKQVLQALIWIFGGKRALQYYREGAFRNSGEIHKWMYDRFSLCQIMSNLGFIDISIASALTSRIASFASFALDELDGKPRKPDSLYIEGIKN